MSNFVVYLSSISSVFNQGFLKNKTKTKTKQKTVGFQET